MPSVPRDFPDPEPHPTTGTQDDEDDPGAEHALENEARKRAVSDQTEAPEEFNTDDEDDLEDRRNDYIERVERK